ncbi:Niemann-Pick type C-2h [Daphnia magna]|uniref:MD-2-related lipid-recognition protein n=2 Tax=Daphnia magna TaxID=35525 RepID=A0A0P4Y6H4_9CRUS|nr:Niemann-Pick type C-2h [Daphnia magna]
MLLGRKSTSAAYLNLVVASVARMANRLLFLILIALPSISYAEKLLSVAACQRGGNYGTGTIKEVRITPCPEAAQRRPCVLKKGTEVTIEVDFIPTVGASQVTGRAFWANRMLELPLPNMNTNACATMTCPVQPNVKQTYRYVLPVSRGFPTRRYDVRWKLTASPFNMCFQFPIQILN